MLSLLTAKAIERMDLEWSEANATAPIGMTAGIGELMEFLGNSKTR